MQKSTLSKVDFSKYKYLFLDRDGVINVERPNDYAKNIDEFVFIEKVPEAIGYLSQIFDRIFLITNQRGIGRGIFTEQDLAEVHTYMLNALSQHGGSIDQIYHCTDISSSSVNRKPNIGMGFKAKADFPEINFEQSIFIGNSRSDIEFGNKLNMLTVLVGDKYEQNDRIYEIADVYCENLYNFVLYLKDQMQQ